MLLERHGGTLGADEEQVRIILAGLNLTYVKFAEAEKEFWNALADVSGK